MLINPIENYIAAISDRYLRLQEENYQSYAELFASTISLASRQIGLENRS